MIKIHVMHTGKHREISPDGEYNRIAQVKHMGVGHFLINQGVLPRGESVTEQLAKINVAPENLDYVILTHLHTDHASGLRQVKNAKNILVSAPELDDTKKYPIRYVKSMWDGINFETFNSLDDELAMNSLKWIRETSLNENCIESLANHDADILPHVIEF